MNTNPAIHAAIMEKLKNMQPAHAPMMPMGQNQMAGPVNPAPQAAGSPPIMHPGGMGAPTAQPAHVGLPHPALIEMAKQKVKDNLKHVRHAELGHELSQMAKSRHGDIQKEQDDLFKS